MPVEPIVTIAVPTHNRASLLEATLASVAAQDFAEFRVVILDNASTDHTESVVGSFTDPRFEYEKSPYNIGLFRNFNRAMGVNRSPYLAIVQDDDILRPSFVRRSLEALEQFPQAAMSFSDVDFIDGEGRRPTIRVRRRAHALSPCSRSDSFRAWLSKRLLHLNMRRSEMTAQLGVDLSLSRAEKFTVASIEIANLTQPGDEYILVDDGECEPDFVGGRRAAPFLERDGQYWGPPADSETAIRKLERMRQRGIALLTILWSAFWWFDYYHAFRDYLHTDFACLKTNSRLIAFDLAGPYSRKD